MVNFVGATAQGTGSAVTLGFQAASGPVSFAIFSAAYGYGSCPPGTFVAGTYQPGDSYLAPTVISGNSNVTTSLSSYTLEDIEEDPLALEGTTSRWYLWTPSYPGTFEIGATTTASSGDEPWISVWDAGLDPWDYTQWVFRPLPGVDGYLKTWDGSYVTVGPVTTQVPVLIRVAAATTGSHDTTLYYRVTTTDPVFVFENNTPVLERTPRSIQVSVTNATPGETVEFTLIGEGVVGELVADDTGTIGGASVVLPGVPAGTYVVRAVGQTSGGEADDTVQILLDARAVPQGPGADVPPDPVSQSTPVRYWVLQDPNPTGLDQFLFPINPDRMSSPYAPKMVDPAFTTARNGQAHIWEGGVRAHAWQFSGYLETAAFYSALLDYADLNARFYLIDHHNRAWTVTFTQVDFQPKRVIGKPWAHIYTVEALIFAGPEVL